jgi:hypothetical protein
MRRHHVVRAAIAATGFFTANSATGDGLLKLRIGARLRAPLLAVALAIASSPVAFGQSVIRGTDPSVTKNAGPIPNEIGTLPLDDTMYVSCQLGSFLTAIQALKRNGSSTIEQIRYSCTDPTGRETAIQGTNPTVAHNENPDGMSATDGLGTSVPKCPSGSFISSIQGFATQGFPSIVAIRYECRTPDWIQVAIKGTDKQVIGSEGPVYGLSGTYALESSVAQCPLGSFVSGLQGFKLPASDMVLGAIRYSCSNLPTASGTITPNYIVLLVAYAPPGTNGGKSTSSVEYGASSTAGTTTSVSNSFKQSMSVTSDVSGGIFGNGVGSGLSFSYGQTVTDDHSTDIKKVAGSNLKILGGAVDGVDRNRDYIYLWLRPNLNLSLTSASAVWTLQLVPVV